MANTSKDLPADTQAQRAAAAEAQKQTPAQKVAEGPTTDRAVNKQINNPESGVTLADATSPYDADGRVIPTGQRSREQEATDEARRRQNDPDAEPYISEGMRHDLEEIGVCNDPVTGRRLTMDKDGKVTAEPRE